MYESIDRENNSNIDIDLELDTEYSSMTDHLANNDSIDDYPQDYNIEDNHVTINKKKRDSIIVKHGNIYFDVPYSPQIYFTVRGAENFHIYLWIAKDLSWTQNKLVPALFFGSCALAWCLVLVYHAFNIKSYVEIYMVIGLMLWLSGNFVWMQGEVVNDDDSIVIPQTEAIFQTAIAWMLFYYLILKPFKVFPRDEEQYKKYDDADLHPRISYFSNWREYEHMHTLCWLGKDYGWVSDLPVVWIICLVPTFLITVDFIWTTWRSKRMIIDCAHYMAQLLWVIGNMIWAMGNLFSIDGSDDDQAYSLWKPTLQAREQCRWWASLALFVAYVPLWCLYFVWLPLTCMGKIKAADIDENKSNKNVDNCNNNVNAVIMNRNSNGIECANINHLEEISTNTNPLYIMNLKDNNSDVNNIIIK